LLPEDKHILSTPPVAARPGGGGFGFGPQTPSESGLIGDVSFVAMRD